jgi:signal transduction histidine kinase
LKVEERTAQLEATQQKLYQTDRLAALGRLAASVAHEINNPLSAVLNYERLMQRILTDEGVPPDRIPEFRRYLAQSVSETTRAGRIVADLLSFSRRAPEERTGSDLNDIVKKTMAVVAHRLELADVASRLALADRLPAVPCDASRIQQVITNLVLNAVDSMPEGGRVEVETRVAGEGRAVEVRVKDSGEGIAEENLPRIFDPFFTTKEEGKGVGLGLAVVYGIVEAHGGSIDVESSVGAGTTFTVRLPIAEEEGEEA